jgi:hypothetical protein
MNRDRDQLDLFQTEPDWDHVRRELPSVAEPPPEETAAQPSDAYSLEQPTLLDCPRNWESLWRGMPSYEQENLMPWQTIKVHFRNAEDRKAFATLIGQQILDRTGYVWYPKAEIGVAVDKQWVTETAVAPREAIYVISKGRWESRQTSKALEAIGVPYRIVVEPQEYDRYAAVIAPEKILVLPFSNLGQGSIPARNWVWEHSIKEGRAWHWIIDDNISGFFRLHQNMKVQVKTGAAFRAIEEFAARYENCVQAGMNYHFFAKRKQLIPPFVPNTRIYSCILLRNDLEFRWRGRYNEDTDLSLRILKAGYCTALFNAFLAGKAQTMTMKGGNTDELYVGDGRAEMAASLRAQHPDVVRVINKWGRDQHYINYKPFQKTNKFVLKAGVTVDDRACDFGMGLAATSRTNYFEPVAEDSVGMLDHDRDDGNADGNPF